MDDVGFYAVKAKLGNVERVASCPHNAAVGLRLSLQLSKSCQGAAISIPYHVPLQTDVELHWDKMITIRYITFWDVPFQGTQLPVYVAEILANQLCRHDRQLLERRVIFPVGIVPGILQAVCRQT